MNLRGRLDQLSLSDDQKERILVLREDLESKSGEIVLVSFDYATGRGTPTEYRSAAHHRIITLGIITPPYVITEPPEEQNWRDRENIQPEDFQLSVYNRYFMFAETGYIIKGYEKTEGNIPRSLKSHCSDSEIPDSLGSLYIPQVIRDRNLSELVKKFQGDAMINGPTRIYIGNEQVKTFFNGNGKAIFFDDKLEPSEPKLSTYERVVGILKY